MGTGKGSIMRVRTTVAAACALALLAGGWAGGGLAGNAAAATARATVATARTVLPSSTLPNLVSQAPVKWTPNVFAGSLKCNPQWFGPGNRLCKHSTVYGTAVVNGEVIVVGAFTQVCQPGTAADGHCVPGTLVTRNDIFAYQLGTGQIDPDFAPVLDQGPVYAVAAGPDGTVYVGGSFITVNGTSEPGLAQLSVTPGQPATDGQVVSGFSA